MKILKFFINYIYIALVVILFSFSYNFSFAQEVDLSPLLDKLNLLERDIRDLQRQVNTGEIPPQDIQTTESNNIAPKEIADHEIRIIELEDQIRKSIGLIEELGFKINKLVEESEQLKIEISEKIASLNEVTNNLEKKNSSEISPQLNSNMEIPPDNNFVVNDTNNSTVQVLATINPAGQDQIINNTTELDNNLNSQTIINQDEPEAKVVYQRAYNLLSRGEYAAAEIAFKSFIKKFPEDLLSSNAYYWLGETFYVRKNYQLAAYNFANGYKNFPKGSKAADQLLKLGISLYSLNKNSEACATFAKLNEEFKELPVRISNRAETFSNRLECKS